MALSLCVAGAFQTVGSKFTESLVSGLEPKVQRELQSQWRAVVQGQNLLFPPKVHLETVHKT